MAAVECPCGECEYRGSVSGVEAHVSGSTDENHKGRSGGEFRDRLIAEAEASVNGETEGTSPVTAVVASTLLLVLVVVVSS